MVEQNIEAVCPRCHKNYAKDFKSLSRKDNETYICGACGTQESFEDQHLTPPYTGPRYWVIV